jgi:hypothetical protein
MDTIVHEIRKSIEPKYDLAYWRYKMGRGLLDLGRFNEWTSYRLSHGLVSRQECTPEFMLFCIKNIPWATFPYFLDILPEDEIPDFVKIAALRQDTYGSYLGLLHNPSNEVITAAITTAGQAIKGLAHPTKKQWELALRCSTESPELIKKRKKPTIKEQIIHITKYGLDGIDYLPTPLCERVKLAAAKEHGIQILKSPRMQNASDQILLAAISATCGATELGYFLHYIPHPSHKIMCAIRHQINMNKMAQAKWAAENFQRHHQEETPEEQLKWLRQACYDPISAAKIGEDSKSITEQIEKLETLRQQTVSNWFNYKNPALAI